jgi:TPR repeat protein
MKKILSAVTLLMAVGIGSACSADAYQEAKVALNNKNYSEAVTMFAKACDNGSAKGCFDLGTLYENGIGVAQNKYQAAALYTQACRGGEASGCSNMGLKYDTP